MKKAFTLIELLVVFAIIGILIAILIPIFARSKANLREEFRGCVNPRVVSTVPSSRYSMDITYVYECEDGRQISSTIRPQDLYRR